MVVIPNVCPAMWWDSTASTGSRASHLRPNLWVWAVNLAMGPGWGMQGRLGNAPCRGLGLRLARSATSPITVLSSTFPGFGHELDTEPPSRPVTARGKMVKKNAEDGDFGRFR